MLWNPLWTVHNSHGLSAVISDNNCSTGVQWIYKTLNDCVWDDRGVASAILGIASLVTWMVVSIPQMIKNCRNIRGVEGISLTMILMWTLGDTASLIGCILTKQLPLQIYMAVYFVFADIILFLQFLYFNLVWKRKRRGYEEIQSNGSAGSPQVVLCFAGALALTFHGYFKLFNTVQMTSSIRHPAGRTLLSTNLQYHFHIFSNTEDKVGYAIGIVSTLFYVGSRAGQMYKNYQRKSTEGLSMLMFILAVLGNLTYGLSILVRDLDGNYVLKHLPWLIGSLGVIFLDLSLLVQFRYYRTQDHFNTLIHQRLDTEDFVQVNPDISAAIN